MKRALIILCFFVVASLVITFMMGRDSGVPDVPASAELLQWEASGQYFDFQGHRIFYQDSGTGSEVILLLHGFPTSSWDWRHIWEAFKGDYRLVTADMLGFGFSDKPENTEYSIHRQADLQEALLAHLGITTIHLFAHDYGDTVAQELIARYNERVETGYDIHIQSLVLLNGGLFPEQHKELFTQTLMKSSVGWVFARLISRSIFEKSFLKVFGEQTKPSPQEMDDVWYVITRQRGHKKFHTTIHYIPDRVEHRERWVSALQQTEVLTLLIDGVTDPVSGGHMVARYEELIPYPNVERLEGIGHYPITEAPQRVIDQYKEFLQAELRLRR